MRHVHRRRAHGQAGLGRATRLASNLRVERLLRQVVRRDRLAAPLAVGAVTTPAAAGFVRVAVVVVALERGQRGGRAARAGARVPVRVKKVVHVPVVVVLERRRAAARDVAHVVLVLREAHLLVPAVGVEVEVDARLLGGAELLEADRVRVVRGEHPALALLVPEEPLAEAREAVAPVALGMDTLRRGKVGGGGCAAFACTTAPTHEDDDEDEGTAERHQEDLPPCQRAADGCCRRRRCGRVDPGDGRERCSGARDRGDDNQIGEADTETGDGAVAVGGCTSAALQDLTGARARETITRSGPRTTGTAGIAGLAS